MMVEVSYFFRLHNYWSPNRPRPSWDMFVSSWNMFIFYLHVDDFKKLTSQLKSISQKKMKHNTQTNDRGHDITNPNDEMHWLFSGKSLKTTIDFYIQIWFPSKKMGGVPLIMTSEWINKTRSPTNLDLAGGRLVNLRRLGLAGHKESATLGAEKTNIAIPSRIHGTIAYLTTWLVDFYGLLEVNIAFCRCYGNGIYHQTPKTIKCLKKPSHLILWHREKIICLEWLQKNTYGLEDHPTQDTWLVKGVTNQLQKD